MKKFIKFNKEILYILICLKALNISQSTVCKVFIKQHNNKQVNFYKTFDDNIETSYNNKMWIIYYMLAITTYQTTIIQKIFSILVHYSKRQSSFNSIVYLIFYKYIKRFIYIFQKHNKYSVKHYIYARNTKTKSLEILALINLYIIYKLSRTKNIFFLYNKLSTKAI